MCFHAETPVKKTRKQKRCDWCGQLIPIGSAAIRSAGNFDGDFYSSILHPECSHACNDPRISDEIRELGFAPCEHSRGRIDDESLPPQYNPDGTKAEESK